MRRIKEVIVVEGRYDKNTLSQAVEAELGIPAQRQSFREEGT